MNHFPNKEPVVQTLSSCARQTTSSLRQSSADFVRIDLHAERPRRLALQSKSALRKRAGNVSMACVCRHPKSIHARMYANQELGTHCNFPGCRCKAYKPA